MPAFHVPEWAPENETPFDLFLECMNFIGCPLGSLAYGIHLVVFLACFRTLLQRLKTQQNLIVYGQLAYISIMFLFGTIGNAWNIQLSELGFVDNRGIPGGPNTYILQASVLLPINVGSIGMYVASTWMQDGLLLLRFFIIYGCNWWFLAFPALVYIFVIVMSCILLAQISRPGGSFFASTSINFALSYSSSSIALTILLTLLIVGRLMHLRHRLRKLFPNQQNPYLTISAMLVESAALYSTLGFVFIILYIKNHPVQYAILPALAQIQMIAPELIILRVAQGHALSKETFTGTLQDFNAPRLNTNTIFLHQINKSSSIDHKPPGGLGSTTGGFAAKLQNCE